MKQYLEEPESMDKGAFLRVEALYERMWVLDMGNKKLPYFLGENKDLGEAKRMQAENKAKRAEFMKKMRAYHKNQQNSFTKTLCVESVQTASCEAEARRT